MELNKKESMLFGQYICAELDCLENGFDPDTEKRPTSVQYMRKTQLESVRDKWAAHQNKAVSITGKEFILPPAKPCELALTAQEFTALEGLFGQLKDLSQHPSKKLPEKDGSPGYLPELVSIIETLKEEGEKNWMILVWKGTKNYIFHFASFVGTAYDVANYLEYINPGNSQGTPAPKGHEWEASVSWNADSHSDNIVKTHSGDNEYIAVPLPKKAKWVFVSQHNNEKDQNLRFKFDFREQLTDYDARMIIKSIWAGACKGGLDNPAAKIMGTEEGAIYANEYLPGDGPLSIIGFPLTLLDGGKEITLDMSALQMSTIDRIDAAMNGMEEAFSAALKGVDKRQSFNHNAKTLRELVETYLIPEVLNN